MSDSNLYNKASLYVGGLGGQIKQADLISLFSRTLASNSSSCKSSESWFNRIDCHWPNSFHPALRREFAIIKVESIPDSEVKLLVKKLQGTSWKGARLKIGM